MRKYEKKKNKVEKDKKTYVHEKNKKKENRKRKENKKKEKKREKKTYVHTLRVRCGAWGPPVGTARWSGSGTRKLRGTLKWCCRLLLDLFRSEICFT